MRGLSGKRVLITGGATGIGRAAALRFAEEGASVAINYIGDPEPAEQLIEELAALCPEGEHLLAPADIADEDAVDSLFAGVVQAWRGLDVLVGNAGIKVVHQPHEVIMADCVAVIREAASATGADAFAFRGPGRIRFGHLPLFGFRSHRRSLPHPFRLAFAYTTPHAGISRSAQWAWAQNGTLIE